MAAKSGGNQVGDQIMKITKARLKEIIKEELAALLAERSTEKENNPWAICTDSVGREDKKKYERCVQSVKKQNKSK